MIMKNNKRMFIAIAFNREIVAQFIKAANVFREQIPDKAIRWTAPSSLHLTICFLGERDASLIPNIVNALDQSVINQQPFKVQFKGLGVFPEKGKARVLWIGIDDTQNIRSLYNVTLRKLLGIMNIERPRFSPHVTIARIGNNLKKDTFEDISLLTAKHRDRLFGKMMVEKVTLFESELLPSGPRYSVIHESMLK